MAPPSPVAQPDGPAIAVRPAGLSDLPTLVAIDALCFPAGIAYSRAEISALLRSPSAVTLVAASSATLVGFAVLEILPPRRSFPRRPSGELVTLDVLPEFRRRRVGHLLYRAVEDRLRARNGTHIGLHVAVENTGAIRFYRQLGYVFVERVPRYYLGTIDAWRMEKRWRSDIFSQDHATDAHPEHGPERGSPPPPLPHE